MTEQVRPDAAATIIHRGLMIGLVALGAAAGWFAARGAIPMLPPGDGSVMVSRLLAGAGAVALAVSLFVLRRRVPAREPGEPAGAFWGRPGTLQRAMAAWFGIEGGALIAGMGFALGGEPLAAGVALAGLAAFVLAAPSRIARDPLG